MATAIASGTTLLPPDWRTQGALDARLADLDGRFTRRERARIGRWLRPAGAEARARLDEFLDRDGVVVTTGQQAGLFTGPLLTVAKALTAVRVAEELQQRLHRPVLPVFWVAADDHDVEEVATTWLYDERGAHATSLSPVRGTGRSVGRIRVSETGYERALDGLSHVTRGQPHEDSVLRWVREAYGEDATLATAFAVLLGRLLEDTPICLLDSSDPDMHRASGPIYEAELELGEGTVPGLAAASETLRSSGVTPPVPILPDATNLLVEPGDVRERLYRRGEAWVGSESGDRHDRAALLGLIRDRPETVSPNVLLRPVVEAGVLPTIVQVGGPSEIGYLAQIGPLFEAHGIERPAVVPRMAVTIVEDWMDDDLERTGLTGADLSASPHVLWDTFARGRVAPELDARARVLRAGLVAAYAAFLDGDREAPEDAVRRVLSLRNRTLALAHDAERALLRGVKRRADDERRRIERLRSVLRPGGGPQDRTINILPFLARYGPGLVGRLEAAIGQAMDHAADGDAESQDPRAAR